MANPIQALGVKLVEIPGRDPAGRAKDAVVHEEGTPQPFEAHPVPAAMKSPAPPPVISNARVTISVDAQLREVIVKVVNPESGDVVRQIPDEERIRRQRAYLESGATGPTRENGAQS